MWLFSISQQMAEIVGSHMENENVKFSKKHVPLKVGGEMYDFKTFLRKCCKLSELCKLCIIVVQVERLEEGQPGKLKVTYKSVESGDILDGEYNTVWLLLGLPFTHSYQNPTLWIPGFQSIPLTGFLIP